MSERAYDAILLDIGDVITARVWDQFDELEQHIGRPIVGRGPLDPASDPAFARYESGELTFAEYWIAFCAANGFDDWRQLFRVLAEKLPHRFGDPLAYALMREAREAGFKVGVLTNDGVAISGREYFDQFPEFRALDAFVDAREFGSAKPDPEPYLRAADALGLPPERVIFLDDAQMCVDGAERVGMKGVKVDPIDKLPAFDLTRELLGLPVAAAVEAP